MVIGASTGGFGTVRSQLHLKQVLTAMGAYMVPYIEVLISHAKEAFDENDKLKDSEAQDRLEALVQKSIDLAKKI
jgi:NAD(P)H-dependent FMN reductase